MNIDILNKKNLQHSHFTEEQIINFLFQHLEQYGDPLGDIQKCLDFALERNKGLGGFVGIIHENDVIAGITIINKTGMDGYIPSNILVYIAVDKKFRGKGVGKMLMKKALEHCEGDVALHVEPDNPARYLYEKLGFTNKYLEMRWQNKSH